MLTTASDPNKSIQQLLH